MPTICPAGAALCRKHSSFLRVQVPWRTSTRLAPAECRHCVVPGGLSGFAVLFSRQFDGQRRLGLLGSCAIDLSPEGRFAFPRFSSIVAIFLKI
jgi:hypothetical protein